MIGEIATSQWVQAGLIIAYVMLLHVLLFKTQWTLWQIRKAQQQPPPESQQDEVAEATPSQTHLSMRPPQT